jgi:hypothetical protein
VSLDVYLTCDCGRSCCRGELFSANITHNLNRMADEAGIYQALWRPEELKIASAGDLIPMLRDGLAQLNADPARFEAFNAANGWGLYEHLVSFVELYLAACEENPRAKVRASR